MSNIKDKIKASIYLHSYFDTLGYGNGNWEFNDGKTMIGNEVEASYIYLHLVHQYFALGGQDISIKKLIASDDTIMLIATGKACLIGGSEKDYIDEYLKILDLLKDDKRSSGIGTLNTLEKIKRAKSIEKLDYTEKGGGNGAAMRTSVIGLIYNKKDDIDKILENSIIASRVTHNNSLGFLGGLVTALFTNYAIRDIPPWEWSINLLDLYKSGKIDEFMKKTNIYQKYSQDKDMFFDKWEQYNEQKITTFKDIRPINEVSFNKRLKFLEEYNDYQTQGKQNLFRYGGSGASCVIVAYDSLLMSYGSNSWPLGNFKELKISLDSLIFFSCLHFGDNDTTGAVAGAWYGALYGFKNFDQSKLKDLEFNQDLDNLTKKIIQS